jgi:hypothetical protein
MIKKGLLTLAVVLLFSAAAMAAEATTDAAFPVISSFQELVDVNCPFLDSCGAGLATGDNQLLGVEFDGTDYWITEGGAQAHGDVNYLCQINRQCVMVNECPQNTTSSWGIRDLAYDVGRDILYGSDDYGVYSFDNSCPVTLTTLVPPSGYTLPARGLAHDPVTDHLWTANFSADIVEWDYTTGTIFCRAANTSWSTYGMAWDDACYAALGYDHPMLWVFSQNGTPALRMELFDPVACRYTGDYCMGIDPVGADDMAGGIAFDAGNYVAGVGALIAMNQGTPQDIIMAYNICNLTGVAMSCTNLSPTFCRGKNVFFQVNTTNNTGGSFNVVMTFTGYSGNGCVPGNEMVTLRRNKTIPMGSNTDSYFFKVPNAAGPGPYSTKISFSYGGNTYECCMDFTCVQCSPWKTGDNTEWVWGEIDRPEVGLPTTTALSQNYPNPFNAETNIGYVLAEAGNVNLSVYDISGRLVETLVDGHQEAGEHIVTWNGSNVSSGIYFYKVATSDYTATKMMNLLK